MNNKEKENNLLITYNSIERVCNIFDYMYIEVENQKSFRKKYNILWYSTTMSATIFRAMKNKIMLDLHLSDMNFLTIEGRDSSKIDL